MKKARGSFQGVPHPKDPTELSVERYLVKRAKAEGWLAVKMEVKGHVGLPDRLLVLPNSVTGWVEVKARRGRLSKTQENKIKLLRKMGHIVEVVWCHEDVDMVIGLLKSTEQYNRLGGHIASLYEGKRLHL